MPSLRPILVLCAALLPVALLAQTVPVLVTNASLATEAVQTGPTGSEAYVHDFSLGQFWGITPGYRPDSLSITLPAGSVVEIDHSVTLPGVYGAFFGVSTQLFTLSFGASLDPAATLSMSGTLHGGFFDGVTTSASVVVANLPAAPAFTPDTYQALTAGNLVGTGNRNLEFTSLVVPGAATNPSQQIVATNTTTNALLFYSSLASDTNTFLLNTDLLQAGMDYRFTLSQGYILDGATYSATTQLAFTAIPEPAGCAGLAGVAGLGLGLLCRWARRRVPAV